MDVTQSGYPVLEPNSDLLTTWVIKTKTGTLQLRLIKGNVGFCLAHLVMWIGDSIQDITGTVKDDWGYAYRPVRGAEVWSNHAGGIAVDIDALKHPLGKRGTWKRWQEVKIRAALKYVYKGTIGWGADYQRRADEMHFEAIKTRKYFVALAPVLAKGTRGKRLLADNPSQRNLIGPGRR